MLDDDFHAIEIPIEPEPGEEMGDTVARYLLEQGVLTEDEDGYRVDLEKAEALNPNIKKFLETILLAETDYYLSKLEEEGLIYSSVDGEGNIIYNLTEAGSKYMNEDY